MGTFGNGLRFSGSLAIGAGMMLLAPVVIPAVAAVIKPLAKGAIKGGILAYDKIKVASAEAVEGIEDLAAEAKAEIADASKPKAKPKKAAAATAASKS